MERQRQVMGTSGLPEKFESEDFVNRLHFFDAYAAANGWNTDSKLLELPAFLRGPALSYYNTLTADQKSTYDILTASLRIAHYSLRKIQRCIYSNWSNLC